MFKNQILARSLCVETYAKKDAALQSFAAFLRLSHEGQ